MPETEPWYDLNEAAAYLKLSRRTLLRILNRRYLTGDFPNAYKTTRAANSPWRIPQSDLDAYRAAMIEAAKS